MRFFSLRRHRLFFSSSSSSFSSPVFTSAHRMNVFISYWVFFSLRFVAFSFLSHLQFLFVSIVFLVVDFCSFFAASSSSSSFGSALIVVSLGNGVGPFFKLLDSLWSGQLLYFISTEKQSKKTKTKQTKTTHHVQQRNEMVEFIEWVPLWLLSYQQMKSKSNIARKFILMIDAFEASSSSQRRRENIITVYT